MAAKDKTPLSPISYMTSHPAKPEKANMQAKSIFWAAFAVLLPFEAALAYPTTVERSSSDQVAPVAQRVVLYDEDPPIPRASNMSAR